MWQITWKQMQREKIYLLLEIMGVSSFFRHISCFGSFSLNFLLIRMQLLHYTFAGTCLDLQTSHSCHSKPTSTKTTEKGFFYIYKICFQIKIHKTWQCKMKILSRIPQMKKWSNRKVKHKKAAEIQRNTWLLWG